MSDVRLKSETLAEIEQEALQVEAELLNAGGELTPFLEEMVDSVESKLASKADSYSAVMQRLYSSSDYLKAKALRYEKAAKALVAYADQMNDRIRETMLRMKRTEIQGNDSIFQLRKIAPAVVVEDETLLPGKYFITKTAVAVSKTLIADDIKEGLEVPGAKLEERFALHTTLQTRKNKLERIK